MWVFYYKNEERISQLTSQLRKEIIVQKTEKTTKSTKTGLGTKAEAGIGGFLSKFISAKGSATIDKASDKGTDIEQKIEYNTKDEKLKLLLEELNKLTVIDKNVKVDIEKLGGLIRFRGDCRPAIPGSTMSERLANYQVADTILWTCKLSKNVSFSFLTTKQSIISSTPISYALSKENGSLFLDVIGAVLNNDRRPIEVIPIIIGTKC